MKRLGIRRFFFRLSSTSFSVSSNTSGMSLMELMIVVTILGILAMLMYISIPTYVQRSNDARRKADLHEYRTVFEEFFADKRRYPESSIMDDVGDCNSAALDPYLDRILCDPETEQPYHYVVSADGLRYWLYTNLADETDPIIAERGCELGCGPDSDEDGSGDFNYGVSSNQAVVGEFSDRISSPPTCPGGCSPNSCGTCCPGAKNRCDPTGTSCYTDHTCP